MFIEITKKYYTSKGGRCSFEEVRDTSPILINLNNCSLIEPFITHHSKKLVLLFRGLMDNSWTPCIEFDTSKALEEEYKRLKNKLL